MGRQNTTEYVISCFANSTSAEDKKELKANLANVIYPIELLYKGYLTLPFAVFGLLFSIIFIIAVLRAMNEKKISKKCYSLIINRSIGDIFACFIALGYAVYLMFIGQPEFHLYIFGNNLINASVWAGEVSYITLSLLKLYAVAQPFKYRNNITLIRCIIFIITSWIFFILLTIKDVFINVGTIAKWSGCDHYRCLLEIERMLNILQMTGYVVTIMSFAFTAFYLYQARKSIRRSGDPNKGFPIWKLASNVATFAIFNLFSHITSMYFVFFLNDCDRFKNYIFERIMWSVARLLQVARISADMVITFFIDVQIQKSALTMFGIQSNIRIINFEKLFERAPTTATSVNSNPDNCKDENKKNRNDRTIEKQI